MCVAAVALFTVGGALEVAGILLVVTELKADRKRALEVAGIEVPWVSSAPTSFGAKSPDWTIQASIEKARELAPLRAQSETSNKLKRALLEILKGNRRARWWGVGLLVTGVVLATAGNVVALAC